MGLLHEELLKPQTLAYKVMEGAAVASTVMRR